MSGQLYELRDPGSLEFAEYKCADCSQTAYLLASEVEHAITPQGVAHGRCPDCAVIALRLLLRTGWFRQKPSRSPRPVHNCLTER